MLHTALARSAASTVPVPESRRGHMPRTCHCARGTPASTIATANVEQRLPVMVCGRPSQLLWGRVCWFGPIWQLAADLAPLAVPRRQAATGLPQCQPVPLPAIVSQAEVRRLCGASAAMRRAYSSDSAALRHACQTSISLASTGTANASPDPPLSFLLHRGGTSHIPSHASSELVLARVPRPAWQPVASVIETSKRHTPSAAWPHRVQQAPNMSAACECPTVKADPASLPSSPLCALAPPRTGPPSRQGRGR
jgi:hypothetical protein